MAKNNLFSLKAATSEDVRRTINYLENNKGLISYTIPVKILKLLSGSHYPIRLEPSITR